MARREEPEPDICAEILRYFLRNPSAADDLEGVARWRLAEERVHACVDSTDAALEALVSQGLLIADASASRRVYRLNPLHRSEAEKFLKSHSDPGEAGPRRNRP